jgi:uncharacterized protein (DUF433 family)
MVDAVLIDDQILGGVPCFAGTRVPVRSLFDHLKLGYTVERFLEQFPTVTKEQVLAVLSRASQLIQDDAREPAHP